MVSDISGVILAGGAGIRFNGIIKAKIVIDGKTIISRIIETLTDIFDEIIIVTNTPDEFQEYNEYKIVSDQFLNRGPLGGIHAALKEFEREGIFAFASDMPLLDKEIIIRQMDFYNTNKYDILIPQIEQYIEPLHGIFNKTLVGVLEDYLGGDNNYTMREFFKSVDTHYFQIEGSEKNRRAFTNINSPSDIFIVKKLLGIK